MPKEKLMGSYLVRFSRKDQHTHVNLQNLKTGEQLSFETWIAAWSFLESKLQTSTLDLSKPKNIA